MSVPIPIRVAKQIGEAGRRLVRGFEPRDAVDASFSFAKRIAKASHHLVREFEPWGVILAFLGLVIGVVTVVIDLEDRQSERTFRAWQVVWGFQEQVADPNTHVRLANTGSSQREAFEYLNRQFDGSLCASWVTWVSIRLTGNDRRECLFPPKPQASLGGVSASGADLQGAFLPRAILTSAILSGATLTMANLTGAELTGADLTGADLTSADLREATVALAELSNAVLAGADLTGADLAVTTFNDSDFVGANLTGADLNAASFTRANLTRANLTRANFRFASLDGANLLLADFTGADLWDADLQGATNLTQEQLDVACGDESPGSLPPGLTWRSGPCLPPLD